MDNRPFHILPATGTTLHALRDDLLPGGTKRRGLERLLRDMPDTDCAYAGTIFGHGALALALACAEAGKRAHLFLSCNDTAHPMLDRLRDAGADVAVAAPLPVMVLFEQAGAWAKDNGAHLFPLAFDTPDFHTAMIRALRLLDTSPYPEIWCSSVSGTLARALAAAYPHTPLKTVCVVAGEGGNFTAPEKYHRPAQLPPPYPSCPYTDAKVWQFAREHAAPGALIWNTAG